MAWDASKPAGADKIKDSDNNIRANNAAIETVLGTNITAGPTSIQGAILGDATKGRNLRMVTLQITDGSNATTLSCAMANEWNGDTIAGTDNIGHGATVGDFTLDADGKILTIGASGLTGNAVGAMGIIRVNYSATDLTTYTRASANAIIVEIFHSTTGAKQVITTLIDAGAPIYVQILYITDA